MQAATVNSSSFTEPSILLPPTIVPEVKWKILNSVEGISGGAAPTYLAQNVAVALDMPSTGIMSLEPYFKYHSLIHSKGFTVPLISGDSTGLNLADYNIQKWHMTVTSLHDNRQVSVCSNEIKTSNCYYNNEIQTYTGGQSCDTIYLHCPNDPEIGHPYHVSITLDGVDPRDGSIIEPQVIEAKYIHTGEEQAYTGLYRPLQITPFTATLHKESRNKWIFDDSFNKNIYRILYPSITHDRKQYIVGGFWQSEYIPSADILSKTGVTTPAFHRTIDQIPAHQLTHLYYDNVIICTPLKVLFESQESDRKLNNPLKSIACNYSTDSDNEGYYEQQVVIENPLNAFHRDGGDILAFESIKGQFPLLNVIPTIDVNDLLIYYDSDKTSFLQSIVLFLKTWRVFDGINLRLNASTAAILSNIKDLSPTSSTHQEDPVATNDQDPMQLLLLQLGYALNYLGEVNHRKYEVSVTLVVDDDAVLNGYDYHQINHLVDHFNIVANTTTEDILRASSGDYNPHNTRVPPAIQKNGSPLINHALQLIKQGVANNKIVLGISSDAVIRDATSINAEYNSSSGSSKDNATTNEISSTYGSVHRILSSGHHNCFKSSKPCGDKGEYLCKDKAITVEDEESISTKGSFVKTHDLAGVVLNALNGDDNGDMLNALLESMNYQLLEGRQVIDMERDLTCHD